jgi:hypothetical protein
VTGATNSDGVALEPLLAERFEQFWLLVADCLRPGGRMFFVDDAHIAPDEAIAAGSGSSIRRRLRDGGEHRIVKVPHTPEKLERRLVALGWFIRVHATSGPFYWGQGALA